MPGFLGADTEMLRRAGAETTRGAERLEDLAERLAALVESVGWVGGDAEAFRADWSGRIRPDLHRCGARLREDARDLHSHAEEQDASSAPDGGASTAPPERTPGPGPGVFTTAPLEVDLTGAGPTGTDLAGVGPLRRAPAAADLSEAIGEADLVFDDTGMRLRPPETGSTITVDADHELAPAEDDVPFGLDADGAPLELAPSTRYEVGEHGTYYTDDQGAVVYVEATGGGEEMNPNLREVFPDATYHVNDSTFYRTDELGRTEHLYVPDVIVDREMRRSQSIQSTIAERWDMTGDDSSEPIEFNAGHVLARQLGGIREEINYTRQWDEVNQSRAGRDTIYTFEDLMAGGISEDGRSYTYETRVTWGEEQPSGVGPEHGSEPWEYVPESYDVRVHEDGEQIVEAHLPNYPEGARFPE